MTPEQKNLIEQANESLSAAKLLYREGYYGFAAAKAYYTMFYIAEAFLLGKDLAFSKHSGVHAAFGEHFSKTGIVPPEFHRYLIRGMEIRHIGDYSMGKNISPEESAEQISNAEQFIKLAEKIIDLISEDT